MPSLPYDPLTNQSGPFSLARAYAGNNVANGNTAPYAPGYLESIGITQAAPTGGGGGGYSAGPTAAQTAAAQQAAAETAARERSKAIYNGALSRLDQSQGVGLQNLADAYQTNVNRLNSDRGIAERNYSTSRNQSTQDNIDARSQIDKNVGMQANALQRLLGSRGAGNSSAARVVAPYAAALQGTEQRTGVAKNYNRNMQSLDTNWQDYGRKFSESMEDLGLQKTRGENALRSSFNTQRASLLEKLQNLLPDPDRYQGEIDSLNNSLPGLERQFSAPVQARNVAYTAPELAQYNVDRAAVNVDQPDNAYEETISPYLALLLGERDQNGMFA